MNRRLAANDNLTITIHLDGFAVREDDKLLRVVPHSFQAIAIKRAFEEVNARFLGLPVQRLEEMSL